MKIFPLFVLPFLFPPPSGPFLAQVPLPVLNFLHGSPLYKLRRKNHELLPCLIRSPYPHWSGSTPLAKTPTTDHYLRTDYFQYRTLKLSERQPVTRYSIKQPRNEV